MKKIAVAAVITALMICGSFAAYKKAPRFALMNTGGSLVKLTSFAGKSNVILAFWASYCKPCKKEMPQLAELEKKYGEAKKLKLVLVNIDREGAEKAMPVLKELGIAAECLLDIYQVTAKNYIPDLKIPATFLINRKGDIVFEAVGEDRKNMEMLEKAIQGL